MASEKTSAHIAEAHKINPRLQRRAKHLGFEMDRLFQSDYAHANANGSCQRCDAARLVVRDPRDSEDPAIHYGTIASSNQLVKNSHIRDKLHAEHGILCFEMEAAGIMNNFPCVVIRGICDYSDSHKSKEWQPYAALTSAAYAKELLLTISAVQVEACPEAVDVLQQSKLDLLCLTMSGCLTSYKVTKRIEVVSDRIEEPKVDVNYKKIHSWLSPVDPSVRCYQALQEGQPGSGGWFIRSAEFTNWRRSPKSSLWLHGDPGCGKTFLSSLIIETLCQSSTTGTSADNPIVLYFYFSFNNAEEQTLDAMGRSLVCQLYSQCKRSQKHLDSLFETCGNGQEPPLTHQLLSAFSKMLSVDGEFFIILDGLDEYPRPRMGFLDWVRKFACSLSAGVHLLVTSRRETDIDSRLGQAGVIEQTVAVQSGHVDGDVCAYIRYALLNDPRFERWRHNEKIRDVIEKSLTKRPGAT